MLVAGIELGGTKCVCLRATGPGGIREELRLETRDPVTTLARIADTIGRWHAEQPLGAVGIAGFGPLDLDDHSAAFGTVLRTPKEGWSGVDLLSPFRSLGLPLAVDTDVNAAALAEGRWGAARGLDHYAYVTVGTGVGVGTVVHGKPIRGLGHCEAGHMRIPRMAGDTDSPGTCPFHGDCVEGIASGPAVAARACRPAEELGPQDPAWPSVVHALGSMLHNLVLTVAPLRIVIGGGLMSGQSHLLPSIRRQLVRSLDGYAHGECVARDIDGYLVAPDLGPYAGPLGAVALALDASQGGHPR